jgi:hypothetical protein
MTPAELDCYSKYLSGETVLLEYGAGGSTSLAAERGVRSLYTVESDPAWLSKVMAEPAVSAMATAGKARLVHVDLGRVKRWGKPANLATFAWWPGYARRPWQDGYSPDLVLVDGRFRVSCIMQTLTHARPGTKIAVHDFWSSSDKSLHVVLPFVDLLESADSLCIFEPKQDPDWRMRLIEARHLFKRR